MTDAGPIRPGPVLNDAEDYEDCMVVNEFYAWGWRPISRALFIVWLEVYLAIVASVRFEIFVKPDYCFYMDCFFMIIVQICSGVEMVKRRLARGSRQLLR